MARAARGAVVDRRDGSIHVEPLDIDPPQAGEVLIRIAASGVCHSDLWAIENGNWGTTPFPMLLGHEGAGIVEEVGPGVSSVAPGDRVVAVVGHPVRPVPPVPARQYPAGADTSWPSLRGSIVPAPTRASPVSCSAARSPPTRW